MTIASGAPCAYDDAPLRPFQLRVAVASFGGVFNASAANTADTRSADETEISLCGAALAGGEPRSARGSIGYTFGRKHEVTVGFPIFNLQPAA